MKLAVIFNDNKLSGRLTKLFTGCYAYHVVWVDEDASMMYDMHLIRRRRPWPAYTEGQIVTFDIPKVTREYLEARLTNDEATYGWMDYLLFLLRPIYHLVGKSTRNAGGIICSEMINNDMVACGVETPWQVDAAPPPPCDIFRWLNRCS